MDDKKFVNELQKLNQMIKSVAPQWYLTKGRALAIPPFHSLSYISVSTDIYDNTVRVKSDKLFEFLKSKKFIDSVIVADKGIKLTAKDNSVDPAVTSSIVMAVDNYYNTIIQTFEKSFKEQKKAKIVATVEGIEDLYTEALKSDMIDLSITKDKLHYNKYDLTTTHYKARLSHKVLMKPPTKGVYTLVVRDNGNKLLLSILCDSPKCHTEQTFSLINF